MNQILKTVVIAIPWFKNNLPARLSVAISLHSKKIPNVENVHDQRQVLWLEDVERHLREEEMDLESHQRRRQELVEACNLGAEQVYQMQSYPMMEGRTAKSISSRIKRWYRYGSST
jgi:hypothetical protein